MISRREVVTAGVLGSIAGTASAAGAEQSGDAAGIINQLGMIRKELSTMQSTLEQGLRGPGLGAGFIADIRDRLTVHWRSAGKLPDFMEIGTDPFYDVYDWHVRHGQQIQIVRLAEQRFAIQFMFTQLIVRHEVDRRFLGQPFDR